VHVPPFVQVHVLAEHAHAPVHAIGENGVSSFEPHAENVPSVANATTNGAICTFHHADGELRK
jgi:hypothetical protein